MKIETWIDALVAYAMRTGLAQPEDRYVLVNRLLEALKIDDYSPSTEPLPETLEEILKGLLDYAVAQGLCADNVTARDLFDTRLMGLLTPMPREVTARFRTLYAQS
ncbi:MAG: galactose-1-phosphate uridylyltransferase, partial [Firmicutes bacterium]|nr:galactose-1-phosphate uridylyltransferase [Bacillota bacterium]